MIAEVLVGYDCPESSIEVSNDSDICGSRGDCVTMSINDKSIDQEKEFMAFFFFDCFGSASKGSRSFSIDCEYALGKDESEDLVEGEWFTVDLASQADGKEGDGFQCLDDAKDLSSVRSITSTYLFKTKRNDTRAPSKISQSFKRPVRLLLLAQYILPIRDDNINPAHTF